MRRILLTCALLLVACSRAEGTIKVTAFLRRGDTWSRPTATCKLSGKYF